MAYTSAKNMMLTPAATDLGYGDAFRQQVDEELDQKKKKLTQQAAAGNSLAAQTLGLAGAGGLPNA